MDKINFQNLPNQTTPINASNLNQLQTNAENGILDRNVAAYNDSTQIDPNTTLEPVILTRHSNGPLSSYFFYIETFSFNGRSLDKNRVQIAYGYTTNEQYQRYYYNGNWYPWRKIPREESGTWTPTINTRENVAPTVTYNYQKGTYKKVSNMVFITFYISGKITALNGTNNYGVVSGLPFVPKDYESGQCGLSIGSIYNIANFVNTITMYVKSNHSGQIWLQSNNGAGAMVLKLSGDANFEVSGSGWYETA